MFSHPCPPAGLSLCSDPDSSAEAAPEEAEAQDLESSDEAEKMSKVRSLNFHLAGRAASLELFTFPGKTQILL